MTEPVPWTFATGGAYSEELGWLTDVLQAPSSGFTQGRRLRDDPRTAISFDTLVRADDRRWMEAQLRAYGAQVWDAPVDIDERRLLADAAVGATVLTVGAVAPARYRVGDRVLLVGTAPRVYEVAELAAVGADSLALAAGLTSPWPAGTRVVPLRPARLQQIPSVPRFTSDATALVRVQFQLEAPLDEPAAFAGATYRGYPVCDLVPVWLSDPTWTPDRLLSSVDNEMNLPAVFDLAGVALDRFSAQYVMTTAAEIESFRSLLWALAGRWSPAWLPTWAHDLRLVSGVGDGSTTLDVEGPLLSATELTGNRRDIRLELFDGTVLRRRITATADLGGGVERLTLDAAIPTGFAPGALSMACFMQLCIQDADVNLLRYFDASTLTCELTWRGLAHDV